MEFKKIDFENNEPLIDLNPLNEAFKQAALKWERHKEQGIEKALEDAGYIFKTENEKLHFLKENACLYHHQLSNVVQFVVKGEILLQWNETIKTEGFGTEFNVIFGEPASEDKKIKNIYGFF